MEIRRHCLDCAETPVYLVTAGTSSGPNAEIRCCADECCLDDARRWVEQMTGKTAELSAVAEPVRTR